MKKISKILVTGGAVLALAGSVAGVATASGSKSKAPKSANESTSAVDTDNIQQGDQTSPDTATVSTKATSTTEQGGEGEGESGSSDGPGGHQDPAGNVDHQFNGEE
jgi:hypothetical protein